MPWVLTEHKDFSGGENLVDSPRALADNQAVLIENFLIIGRGQVQTREGMIQVPGSATFPKRIDLYQRFLRRDGTVVHFVISDRKLMLENGTVLISNLSGGPYGWTVAQGKFLLVDGTNYYESDGTVEGSKPVPLPSDPDATLDEIRRCTVLFEHAGTVYASGDPQNPGAIYYSQPLRYDYFKGGQTPDMMFQVSTGDEERPVILTSLFGGILLGKPTGWWIIRGDPHLGNLNSSRIVYNQGPVSPQFVVVRGTELWYRSDDGIRVLRQPYENVYTTLLSSYEHQPLLNEADMSSLVMAYFDGRILFFYKRTPSSSDNDFCSVLDLRFADTFTGTRAGAWTRITGWPVTSAFYHDNTLWAGLADGRLVRLFEGEDDLGIPIRSRLWTPEYALDTPSLFKMFDGVDVHAAQEESDSQVLVHEARVGSARTVTNIPLLGFRGSAQYNVTLRPRLRGTYIQHRIESSQGRLTLLSVGERWRPLRPIRAHEVEGNI